MIRAMTCLRPPGRRTVALPGPMALFDVLCNHMLHSPHTRFP